MHRQEVEEQGPILQGSNASRGAEQERLFLTRKKERPLEMTTVGDEEPGRTVDPIWIVSCVETVTGHLPQ
jgi:hypothetical protein